LVALTAASSLVAFLLLRRAPSRVNGELASTVGVLTQFVFPPIYLVLVPLTGYIGTITNPFLDAFPEAIVAALVGQTLFVAGYNAAGTWRRVSELTPRISNAAHFVVMMAPLLVAVWSARLLALKEGMYYHTVRTDFMFRSSYASLLSIVGSWGLFVAAGAWWLRFRLGRNSVGGRWTVLSLAVTGLEVLWYLPTGSRENLALSALTPVVAFAAARKRWPVKSVAIIGMGLCASMPVLQVFRETVVSYVEPTTVSRGSLLSAAEATRGAMDRNAWSAADFLTVVFSRLADIRYVAAIIKGVPNEVALLWGQTYYKSVFLVVPRFLYPEKPQMILPINEWFFTQHSASAPTTLVGEAYLNFGWLGLFVAPPVVGFALGKLERYLDRRCEWLGVRSVRVGIALIVARMVVQNAASWFATMFHALLLATVLQLWQGFLAARGERSRKAGCRVGRRIAMAGFGREGARS